jgi:hypothetical protein
MNTVFEWENKEGMRLELEIYILAGACNLLTK